MSFYCCPGHRGIFCTNAIRAKKRYLIYARYCFKIDSTKSSLMKPIKIRECLEYNTTYLHCPYYTIQIDGQNYMIMAPLRQVPTYNF